MKQEERELLLKDLCARLPYGVMLKTDNVFPQKLEGISFDKDTFVVWVSDGGFTLDYMDCKPYLFPLSSMTEEQKEDLYIVTNGKFNAGYEYIDNCKPRNWSEWGTTEYNWIRHYDIDLLYTWLNENHFDYRGLIPMGLAIDATGKNIY